MWEQTGVGFRGAVILSFLKGSRHSHDFGYTFSLPPHDWSTVECAPFRRRDWDDKLLGVTAGDWGPVAHSECCVSSSGHAMQVCLWCCAVKLGCQTSPGSQSILCWLLEYYCRGSPPFFSYHSSSCRCYHICQTACPLLHRDAGLRWKERKEHRGKIRPPRGWRQIKTISVVWRLVMTIPTCFLCAIDLMAHLMCALVFFLKKIIKHSIDFWRENTKEKQKAIHQNRESLLKERSLEGKCHASFHFAHSFELSERTPMMTSLIYRLGRWYAPSHRLQKHARYKAASGELLAGCH